MSREASTRRGGLGRGLAALIPTGPPDDPNPANNGPRLGNAAADVIIGGKPAAAGDAAQGGPTGDVSVTGPGTSPSPTVEEMGAVYRELRPLDIQPNPQQPRTVFDDEAMSELVHSIREFGLMQPIVVRELPEPTADGVRYQLVMGERRWRASQEAGLEAIPAIVRETSDGDMLRDALLENIHRAQLNPLEEAAAYQQLLDEFGVTHEELAKRIGRSRPLITNMIRLLKLPIPVQRRVAAGVLSAGHARALLSLETGPDAQEALAARIVAEGLSVRATEEAVTLANHDGADSSSSTPVRRKAMQMPGLQDLAERLSDRLDTRVTVGLGKRKGKIVVEFGSVEDLERIVGVIDPK